MIEVSKTKGRQSTVNNENLIFREVSSEEDVSDVYTELLQGKKRGVFR